MGRAATGDADIEKTCGRSGGRGGRDELRGQHGNTHFITCYIDSQWEFAI